MAIGGYVISKAEGWNLREDIYFCRVSFSTIGYGDYAPVAQENWDFPYYILLI